MSDPVPWDHTPVPRLKPREPESHKGHFGHLLVVGGSQGLAGAVVLAARAALRSGTGLVSVAVPQAIYPPVAAQEPAMMVWPLACDSQGRLTPNALEQLEPLLARATAVALGPGLGQSPGLTQLVSMLYTKIALPMVVDADGLNALAQLSGPLRAPAPRVLTPHPGEFARLCGHSTREVLAQRCTLVAQLARAWKAVVVLKGHRTLICDGQQISQNLTGNPGMATGGSGDVLTGVLGALLAQGWPPYPAARLATFVHGKAGDLAAVHWGQVAMTASDLVEALAWAWQKLEQELH